MILTKVKDRTFSLLVKWNYDPALINRIISFRSTFLTTKFGSSVIKYLKASVLRSKSYYFSITNWEMILRSKFPFLKFRICLYSRWEQSHGWIRLFSYTISISQTLNLAHNEIKMLNDSLFSGLSQLQVLQLEGNMFTQIPTKSLASLGNLKLMTIQENDISKSKWNCGAIRSIRSRLQVWFRVIHFPTTENWCSSTPRTTKSHQWKRTLFTTFPIWRL